MIIVRPLHRRVLVFVRHFLGLLTARRSRLETYELSFHDSISEYRENQTPSIVLLSSALQYRENPHQVIAELISLEPELVIVDRTPVHSGEEDLLMVQQVARSVNKASYPMWAFSRAEFLRRLPPHYELLSTFSSNEGSTFSRNVEIKFEGFLFRKGKK